MERVAFSVELREGKGKGPARQMRMGGRVPAVMYGTGGSTPISISRKELVRLIKAGGGNMLLNVTVVGAQGGVRLAILKDYQTDPLKNELLHADLLEVAADKLIHVTVPIVLTGDSKGVKAGGIMQYVTRDMLVECLPDKMPDHIFLDASGLEIGDTVHVGDLKLPEGVKAMTDAEKVVVTVAAPITAEKLEEMLSVEAAAAVKEPEVLKAKKEEEEPEKK